MAHQASALARALLHAIGIFGGLWVCGDRLRARLAGALIALAGVWLLAEIAVF